MQSPRKSTFRCARRLCFCPHTFPFQSQTKLPTTLLFTDPPDWRDCSSVWETVRMANGRGPVPKEGDRVRTPNVKDGFVVVAVRENPNVVDLDLPNGPLRIKNIPWTMLTYLDSEEPDG